MEPSGEIVIFKVDASGAKERAPIEEVTPMGRDRLMEGGKGLWKGLSVTIETIVRPRWDYIL